MQHGSQDCALGDKMLHPFAARAVVCTTASSPSRRPPTSPPSARLRIAASSASTRAETGAEDPTRTAAMSPQVPDDLIAARDPAASASCAASVASSADEPRRAAMSSSLEENDLRTRPRTDRPRRDTAHTSTFVSRHDPQANEPRARPRSSAALAPHANGSRPAVAHLVKARAPLPRVASASACQLALGSASMDSTRSAERLVRACRRTPNGDGDLAMESLSVASHMIVLHYTRISLVTAR